MIVVFFFQAEDGIRDADVTGVQTCALPIYHRDQGDPLAGVLPVGGDLVGDQEAHHLVGGPFHGRHGGDAEALVDLGAARVVDAGDHRRHLELLPGQPRGDDVGVVAVGHRRERSRPLDPGLAQHVLVEPVAVHLRALEVEAQHPERDFALVDDGDRMAAPFEPGGQLRTDPATTHDHDVHDVSFLLSSPSNRTAVSSGTGECTDGAKRTWPIDESGPILGGVPEAIRRGGAEEGAEAVSVQAGPELDETPERPVAGTASNVPSQRYQSLGYRGKRVLLGPPLKTSQLVNERITKRVALAVFSSDPISSTAYATEEILRVLVLAAAISLTLPISLAIAGLLLLLVISYRQVIDAYPSAGGAYVVSRDNFGNVVASVAGAALLIDYILTVAVSVSSGVGNMISAFGPDNPLVPWQVEIAIGFIVLLAWGNLRGIREAGRIFAIPTYLYVVSMGAMVGMGIVRVLTGSLDNVSYSAADQAGLIGHGQAVEAVTLFLVLRAFASGTTALTGVEAVSNGVSAFRRLEARNAKTTLLVMAFIMGSLFLGISFLAGHLGIKPFQDEVPTVVAQLGQHVLGSSPLGHAFFLLTQGATLMILVLAANTSFSGFPLLASFAAGDALLPRQLRKRGHRLVYSNGILVLSAVAILLVMAFHASTSALIPLYAISVIISFTLSQAGMTKRHWKLRERGWRY